MKRILLICLLFSSAHLDEDSKCILYIRIKNSSSLKKLTIGNGSSYLYYCEEPIINKRGFHLQTPGLNQFPKVIIINDDIETLHTIFIENTAFYVDIDAESKPVSPLCTNSLYKYRASILNNTFDSLCAVYKPLRHILI